MSIKFKNNASTTLASDITDFALSLSVAAGTGSKFPSLSTGQYFYCTIVAPTGTMEIVKVTARSTDTFTIVRAQEGTSASAFSAGATVENRMTAGSFTDMLTACEAADALPTPVNAEFLGAYSSGAGEWESKTASELRTQLGSTTVGGALFTAASVAAAQQAIDVEVGVDVQAYDVDTLKADVHDVRTKSHPSTVGALTGNSVTPDLTTAEVFQWGSITAAMTLNAPTIPGAGIWVIECDAPGYDITLPKATFDGSTLDTAVNNLILIIGFASGDYELAIINGN